MIAADSLYPINQISLFLLFILADLIMAWSSQHIYVKLMNQEFCFTPQNSMDNSSCCPHPDSETQIAGCQVSDTITLLLRLVLLCHFALYYIRYTV